MKQKRKKKRWWQFRKLTIPYLKSKTKQKTKQNKKQNKTKITKQNVQMSWDEKEISLRFLVLKMKYVRYKRVIHKAWLK